MKKFLFEFIAWSRILIAIIINPICYLKNEEAMVWYYLVLAFALSAAILFGSCMVIDYCTYQDLKKRLLEERRRRLEKETVAAYT